MKRLPLIYASLSAYLFLLLSCGQPNVSDKNSNDSLPKPGISKSAWGQADGNSVFLYTLTNHKGDQIKISNYGGTVVSWRTAEKSGKTSDIIIGFDSLAGYLQKPPYFGALIGRYGNRIGNSSFVLDGATYHLAANNGKNSLHGGLKGFDKRVWEAEVVNDSIPTLLLSYKSADGEEGFPGNLKVTVKYSLSDEDALSIEYNAQTDKATPVNLTNHSYFNLSGSTAHSILEHTLMINADRYTPVDSTLIPTGEIKSVKGGPFDFTLPKKIGRDISLVPGGYDHNFVLNVKDSLSHLAAVLSDSLSGRKMEVFTTEPGLQFYTGNFLDGKFSNHDGKSISIHTALCLETQHFPDSPNKPEFPSTILRPGQKYHTLTIYRISIMP